MSWHIFSTPDVWDSDGYGSDDDYSRPDEYGNEDFEYESARDDAYMESLEKEGY